MSRESAENKRYLTRAPRRKSGRQGDGKYMTALRGSTANDIQRSMRYFRRQKRTE
jgi:hypothetical protein